MAVDPLLWDWCVSSASFSPWSEARIESGESLSSGTNSSSSFPRPTMLVLVALESESVVLLPDA